ncbi:hypothetical protein [Achromobacter aloeverae]
MPAIDTSGSWLRVGPKAVGIAVARQAFSLPDVAARQVMLAAQDLDARFPGAGGNREFLEGFIRATHRATGQLVGVPSIQRLLRTYAPARRPSTATILDVKRQIEATLQSLPPSEGLSSIPQYVAPRRANASVPVLPGMNEDPTALRLLALELEDQRRRRQTAEVENSRLLAALQAATEQLAATRSEAATSSRMIAELIQKMEQLTAMANRAIEAEIGARNFALQAIESARGESRTWRERYDGVEALRQQERTLLDSYRQQIQRGRS